MSAVSTAAHAPLPPLSIRAWLRYDVVSRALAGLGPESVLEIGCGQGALGARLAEASAYTGVEPDAASYATAAARIEPRGGRVVHGTDSDLQGGETFDAVCAFEVLEHIDDDRAALARWASHLRPGGHLVLSVPAFQERFGPMDAFAGHYRRYEPETLKERLAEAGLTTRQLTVYAWPLGYALESVRNRIDEKKLAAARADGTPIEDLSAASGRTFQPGGVWKGRAVQAAVLPFRALQRLQPGRGIGMVVVAQS